MSRRRSMAMMTCETLWPDRRLPLSFSSPLFLPAPAAALRLVIYPILSLVVGRLDGRAEQKSPCGVVFFFLLRLKTPSVRFFSPRPDLVYPGSRVSLWSDTGIVAGISKKRVNAGPEGGLDLLLARLRLSTPHSTSNEPFFYWPLGRIGMAQVLLIHPGSPSFVQPTISFDPEPSMLRVSTGPRVVDYFSLRPSSNEKLGLQSSPTTPTADTPSPKSLLPPIDPELLFAKPLPPTPTPSVHTPSRYSLDSNGSDPYYVPYWFNDETCSDAHRNVETWRNKAKILEKTYLALMELVDTEEGYLNDLRIFVHVS
jgi:hypothetical protein